MNPKQEQKAEFRYGVYTRRSSEYEESQVQSIQRQIDELSTLIDRDGLVVFRELLQESQSAFHPGRRQFAKLVEWTNRGWVNAWLCWHANRLSRNPVDAGTIVYLMDQGKLHHIRTSERVYYNTPTDKLMLQIDFSMSKKDSDDKSALVKSGILRRYRRGYPSSHPPPGFVLRGRGRSGNSFWVPDPERFLKVKQVFLRFLEGNSSLSSIHAFARDIGLTSLQRKQLGGREISRSAIHTTVLLNPVYAGYFHGSDGERYQLDETLPRAITEDEHLRIRTILGQRNLTGSRTTLRDASYRGVIFCPRGHALGVEHKTQLICDCRHKFSYLTKTACPSCGREIEKLDSPRFLFYTYYYSVRDRKCKTATSRVVEEHVIDGFLVKNVAQGFAISKPLRDWAIRYLADLRDEELRDRAEEARLEEGLRQAHAMKRKRLRELYLAGQVTEEEYASDLAELTLEFERQERAFALRDDWFEDTKKILDLATEMEFVLAHGPPGAKRQAILDLGSHLLWDGKNLSISNVERVNVLIEGLKTIKSQNPAFEPEKTVDTSGRNEPFRSVRPTLCALLDEVRTAEIGLSTREWRKAA